MQDDDSHPPENTRLWVLPTGGCDYLFYRKDKASDTDGLRMPLNKISSWFERNGTLKSHDELIQQLSSMETFVAGTSHDQTISTAATSLDTKEAMANENSNNVNNMQSLTTTASQSVPTSPGVTVNIYPLPGSPSTPSQQAPRSGIYLLITEVTHRNNNHGHPLARTKLSYLMIANCSGYWVSDYCGMGGFQQVVFFPARNDNPDKRPPPVDSTVSNYEQFLLQGAILTDGLDVWLPSAAAADTIQVQQVSLSSWIYKGVCTQIVLPGINASCTSSSAQPSTKDSDIAATLQDTNPRKRPIDGASRGWRDTLELSLVKQLRQRQQERQKHQLVKRSRDYVLGKSQEALQQLIQNDFLGNGLEAKQQSARRTASTMKITELRYRVFPRASRTIGATNINLWMEVDLMVPNISDNVTNSIQSTEQRAVMKNVHLYCTPSRKQSKGPGQTIAITAECQSAVIPMLSRGDHVTLLLSLDLDNVFLMSVPSNKDETNTKVDGVELTLGSIGLMSDCDSNADRRCGFCLGSFLLPTQAILQAPFCDKMYHHTFATKQERQPSTIYDCRSPHRLTLDVSNCPNFSLSEFLGKINQQVSGRCPVQVDKSETQGEEIGSTLTLSIFAMKRSDVAGKLAIPKFDIGVSCPLMYCAFSL